MILSLSIIENLVILGVILKYLSLIAKFGNLDINLGGYFKFTSLILEFGSLDVSLGAILNCLS